MQSSLWWQQEKSVCLDQCCRDLCVCVCVQEFLVPTDCRCHQPGQQSDRRQGLISALAFEKERRGREEEKRETEWKFNQPLLLKGWLGARRIYSCLASSPASRRVSLQLLNSLLHSVTECTCLSMCLSIHVSICHGTVYSSYLFFCNLHSEWVSEG